MPIQHKENLEFKFIYFYSVQTVCSIVITLQARSWSISLSVSSPTSQPDCFLSDAHMFSIFVTKTNTYGQNIYVKPCSSPPFPIHHLPILESFKRALKKRVP